MRLPVDCLFVRCFADGCFEACLTELNDPAFKNKPKREKDKITAAMKRAKHAIKCVLWFADEFPPPRPEDSKDIPAWGQKLSLLAESALNKMKDELPNPPANITQGHLLKSCVAVREWPLTKKAPRNAPAEHMSHFGSNLQTAAHKIQNANVREDHW